jgi:DNA polymerase-3 subunit delta'
MIYPWQQSQWQHVSKLLSTQRLPHAMLLLGSNGLGKTGFAYSLANAVLCQQPTENKMACGSCKSCLLLAAGTHPDLHTLKPTPPPNSKSSNPVLSIKIDVVRTLCDQLNQTSQYGQYRVAILEQADLLNLSAANSLLKTLEEPGQNVLILMVTSRPHRLPVTIRSRCQTLRFSTPGEELSLDWLQKNNDLKYTNEQLQQVLKQTFGSPLAALQQLEELGYQQILTAAMTAKISGNNTLEYATKLSKFSKIQTLEGMLVWTSDLAKVIACGSTAAITNESERKHLLALAQKVNSRRLFKFQDQLNFNLLHSTIAVNEQLLWENLLLSWDNL